MSSLAFRLHPRSAPMFLQAPSSRLHCVLQLKEDEGPRNGLFQVPRLTPFGHWSRILGSVTHLTDPTSTISFVAFTISCSIVSPLVPLWFPGDFLVLLPFLLIFSPPDSHSLLCSALLCLRSPNCVFALSLLFLEPFFAFYERTYHPRFCRVAPQLYI